jgi:hypothetical protein
MDVTRRRVLAVGGVTVLAMVTVDACAEGAGSPWPDTHCAVTDAQWRKLLTADQ